MTKEGIAKLLLELKAVALNTQQGFLYASGRKGPIYCDNRLILSYTAERNKVIEEFLQMMKDKRLDCDVVAGVATAGIPWAAFLADRLKKPMLYVRASAKDHGKENQIEGELEEGKKVIVIDDLINTGGSSVAACQAISDSGGKVIACLAIFSYSHDEALKLFTDAKVPLYSLSDFNILIKVAIETKYITDKDRQVLIAWHRNPKDWDVK